MEELIIKYNLQPTDIQTGETFRNNVIIYSLFDDFLIGECNTLGERTPGRFLIWNKNKPQSWRRASIDFLKHFPVDEFRKILTTPRKFA